MSLSLTMPEHIDPSDRERAQYILRTNMWALEIPPPDAISGGIHNKHGRAQAGASGDGQNNQQSTVNMLSFYNIRTIGSYLKVNLDTYESRIGRGGCSGLAAGRGEEREVREGRTGKDRAESSLFKTNVAVDKDFDSFQAYMVDKQQQRQGKQQQVSDMNFDGSVEPPGRPVGGVEGPTPRGEGSVIKNTQTATSNSGRV